MRERARYVLRVTLLALVCVVIALGGVTYWALRQPAPQVPSFESVRNAYEKSEALLLDRHGNTIHELRTDFKGRKLDWVQLTNISPALLKAVIVSEDRRFYGHTGVDLRAICAAAVRNLLNGEKRGASTITMQLASITNKETRPRSLRRNLAQKWRQIRIAWQLERTWSKQEILEAYLNLVSFRGELQGVAAAARGLLRKEPSGLSENESLVLAALIRSPNAPADRVAQRARLLAEQMHAAVSRADLDALTAAWLAAPPLVRPSIALAPHVARYLLKPGTGEATSTLDRNLQSISLGMLQQAITDLQGQNARDGAVLVLSNKTGEVLAYVANTGLNSRVIHVDGIRAKRQAGSTLKPFLYAMALERRLITAASLLEDTPIDISTETGIYKPENYDNRYRGHVPARIALASSLNIPAVRVLLLTGTEPFVQKLEALGFGPLRDGEYYGHSLALGTVDVSLWELTNAYRALANAGRWSEAALEQNGGKQTRRTVFSREVTFIVNDILSDREARSTTFGLENPLSTGFWTAVKTGTSKDMRDNWCVGFSRDFTVGVWVGNFSGDAMWNVSGVSGAAPVWLQIMKHLHRDHPSQPPSPPDGLLRATAPGLDQQRYTEWFLQGTDPGMVQYVKVGRLPRITYPPAGTLIAFDPDIPADHQKVFFQASGSGIEVTWLLDGNPVGAGIMQAWTPRQGHHRLRLLDAHNQTLDEVTFTVRE